MIVDYVEISIFSIMGAHNTGDTYLKKKGNLFDYDSFFFSAGHLRFGVLKNRKYFLPLVDC